MKYHRITVPKYKYHAALITILILVAAIILMILNQPKEFVSPLPQSFSVETKAVAVYLEPETIEEEIRAVFGKHADRAFELLECENKTLDPEAVNDNTAWGGVGKDWGIFQINDHWQGVSNTAFLKDPDVNIRMAYNIFERSGYTFKMWTCGKKLGI